MCGHAAHTSQPSTRVSLGYKGGSRRWNVVPHRHTQKMVEYPSAKLLGTPGLHIRNAVLTSGWTRGRVQYQVDSGRWERVHEGLYIDLLGPDEAIRAARTAAHLLRAGEWSCLSHDSAAALHGLDRTGGWKEPKISILLPMRYSQFTADGYRIRRSRTLTPDQVELIDGVPVTSRARTTIDVCATLTLDEGERVLESALRGPNTADPHKWRVEVYWQILDLLVRYPHMVGAGKMKRLLARRPPECLPTGSIGETAMVQILRSMGITRVSRQAHVIAKDEFGNPRDHFLDLMLDGLRVNVEVDGSQHTEAAHQARDAKRDARLSPGFAILRFPATAVLFEPGRVAAELREALDTWAKPDHATATDDGWIAGQVRVTGKRLEWRIDRIPPPGRLRRSA
jgi:very-short-patch-repair endonuclease